jgi:Derlin-2/3
LAGATLLISFSSLVLRIVNPMHFIYIAPMVFSWQRLQLWRLVTSFLLSGPNLVSIHRTAARVVKLT